MPHLPSAVTGPVRDIWAPSPWSDTLPPLRSAVSLDYPLGKKKNLTYIKTNISRNTPRTCRSCFLTLQIVNKQTHPPQNKQKSHSNNKTPHCKPKKIMHNTPQEWLKINNLGGGCFVVIVVLVWFLTKQIFTLFYCFLPRFFRGTGFFCLTDHS